MKGISRILFIVIFATAIFGLAGCGDKSSADGEDKETIKGWYISWTL